MSISQSLTVKKIDYSHFKNMHAEWSDLLQRSDADKLFLSWIWQYTWWEVFANSQNCELFLLAVYDKTETLLGLAPLYIQVENSYGLKIRRVQFLGNMWRHLDNIRSEYIDFIVDKSAYAEILNALLNAIFEYKNWDEFVITNHWLNTESTNNIKNVFKNRKCILRISENGQTYKIDTSGNFNDYLKSLSPKSRAKIYNQRNKLKSHGNILREKATKDTLYKYFDVLNKFHCERWGKDVFEGKRLEFHKKIAMYALDNKILDFEILSVDNKPISILYDFSVCNKKYGYQLGFDDKFDKRISVNQLHFGYSIESAFDDDVIEYDFLRGVGRNNAVYKSSITQPYKKTATLQVIRKPLLKILYRAYDMYKYPEKIK